MKAEATLLMNKIRYFTKDDWEFERLVKYLRLHPDELADAGEEIIEKTAGNLLDDIL